MQHNKLRLALHGSNAIAFDMRNYKSMGEPVGDAFGGAAYGEKNSKLFKVIAAVAGVALAIPTGGLSLQMTLMQGIAFAGAALNLVGVVTGNSMLSKIGGFASLGAGLANAFQGNSALWNGLKNTATGTTEAGGSSLLDAAKIQSGQSLASTAKDIAASDHSALFDTMSGQGGMSGGSIIDRSALNNGGMPNVNSSMASDQIASEVSGGGYDPSSVIDNSTQAISNSSFQGNLTVDNPINLPQADNRLMVNSGTADASGTGLDITRGNTGVYGTNASNTQVGLLGNIKDSVSGVFDTMNKNPVATKLISDFLAGAIQSPQDKAMAQYYLAKAKETNAQMANAQAIPTMNLQANPNANVQFNTAIRAPRGNGLLNRNQQV